MDGPTKAQAGTTHHQTTNKQQYANDREQQEDGLHVVHAWLCLWLVLLVLLGQDLLRVLPGVHGFDLLLDL